MKNMKIRKKIFFNFFPSKLWSHKEHGSCKFFLPKKFFLLLRSSVLQVFGWICLMCLHLEHFRWPNRLPWSYYIIYYIHFLSQKFPIDAQVVFRWNLIWKLTHREMEKIIAPSGQVYLTVYTFESNMKFISG